MKPGPKFTMGFIGESAAAAIVHVLMIMNHDHLDRCNLGIRPYIVFGTSDPFRRMHDWHHFCTRHL